MIKKYWWMIPLAIITISGLALRIYHLDFQCFATDELYTIKAAPWSSTEIILWSLGGDYNPPLYYLFAHYSSLLFGDVTSFAIRFPAAIFGTLCIPAAFVLGKEFKNEILGLLMAATICFLYPLIYYSQDARAYSLVMLAFIGYILFFIRVYRGDISTKTIAFGIAFAALSLWSHFYSIVPLAVSLGILLLKYQRIAIFGSAMVVLACLPFVRYIGAVANQFHALSSFVHTSWWLGPLDVAMLIPWELFGWAGLAIIPLAALTLYRYRDSLDISLIVIAAISALSCLPMTALTAMSPRYTLLVSPIVLLVALYPISEFIDNQKTPTKKFALFSGITFVLFFFNYGSIVQWFTVSICPLVNLALSPW